MHNSKRRLLAALLCLPLVPAAALAQPAYPNKQVRIVLGYSPGGTADTLGRIVAERLRLALGQAVVFENRPGASGNIAAQLVSKSAPDGYTLLMGNTAEIAINKNIMKNMGFDPDKDLEPIAPIYNVSLGLAIPAKSPYGSLQDLLAAAKKEPGKVTFASAGSGSPGHLAAEALALKAKVKMTHVPYKGAAPALTDVMGGHVDSYFAGVTAISPHLKAGNVKIIAVSSAKRADVVPTVPTVSELGIPDFDFTLWGGLFAPAGTPREIIARLNAEMNKIFLQPEVKERLEKEGSDVLQQTPEQYAQFVKRESAKYTQIMKDIGYKGEQ